MKKYLIALISIMLLLPMAVHADMIMGSISTNNYAIVGGYKEIYIEIPRNDSYKIINEITLEYDSKYFSISKENISVETCFQNITNEEIDIKITNGKVSIKSNKENEIELCPGNSGSSFNITALFTTIKAGSPTIKVSGYNFGPAGYEELKTTITEPNCSQSSTQECPKCEEKECPTVEEKECPKCEEKECPVCEEKKCPENVTEKKSINGKTILIMICSFLIGAALASMIFLIIRSNSKKKEESANIDVSHENIDMKE